MKNIYTIALLLLAFVPMMISCDDETGVVTPPTPEQVLLRTWIVEEVEVREEGVVVSAAAYTNFTIRFAADGQYFVNQTNDAFPLTSGTWQWEDENVKRNLILDAGTDYEVLLVVESLEAARLAFRFEREGFITENGRALVIPDRLFYFVMRSL